MLDKGVKPDEKLEIVKDWVVQNSDKYLFMSEYENMDVKRPAVSVLEKLYPLTITLQEAYDRTVALRDKYGSRAESAETAKGVDWKATSHAVRITMQAIDILTKGELVFPFPPEDVKLLLEIKTGQKTFDEVEKILTDLFELLDDAKTTTALPSKDAAMEERFEEFMAHWMDKFYQ